MSLKCAYHPDRDASEKCENCNRVICLECKKAFSVTHGTQESRYSTKHEFCLPCYYDREIKKAQSGAGCIICIVFNIIGLIMFNVIPMGGGGGMFNLIMLIPTIIFSIALVASITLFIYGKFVGGPKKVEMVKAQKESFLENAKLSSQGRQEITPIISKKFCSRCGSQIEQNISICPNCGSDISD